MGSRAIFFFPFIDRAVTRGIMDSMVFGTIEISDILLLATL
jgi:hypothetical protein